MRIVVDPPITDWRPQSRGTPTLATGHQASLWHPGILAKDIAMDVAAHRLGAQRVHLVVNHDVHPATTLQVPVLRGDHLTAESITLGPQHFNIPNGFQPAVEPQTMLRALDEARKRFGDALRADLEPLMAAIRTVGPQPSLAAQMAGLTRELMRPYAGDVPMIDATALLEQAMPTLRFHLLEDARRCAACYNDAVRAYPQAGMTPLIEERDRVELPLWLVRWKQPRQRVYADLADSRQPLLTQVDGAPIEDDAVLAPRALMLTALARSTYSLFIHGTGGGVYDQVMQRWWTQWTGQPLAPMAVVTADVHLELDAPVADPADLTRAVWYRHHLPHNVDRVLDVKGPVAAEKHALLAHMDDDRDKARRAAAFKRLQHVNAQLVREHPRALEEADQRLRRARMGLRNAGVARKRDWCFALYPPARLHALREAIEAGKVQCQP